MKSDSLNDSRQTTHFKHVLENCNPLIFTNELPDKNNGITQKDNWLAIMLPFLF